MQVDYSKLWERYKEKGYKNKTDLISLAALLDEINNIQTNADKENDIMGRVYVKVKCSRKSIMVISSAMIK